MVTTKASHNGTTPKSSPIDHQPAKPPKAAHALEEEESMHLDNPLAEAGRSAVHGQLQKLEKAKKEIEDTQDPAAIHAMRVATRRLRTALKILGETVEDPKLMDYFRKSLHKLTDQLSQVRDTDVFLEHLDKYQAGQPTEQKAALQPLAANLNDTRKHALADLTRTLQKHKIQHLLHQLTEFSKRPAAEGRAFKNPDEIPPTLVRHFVGSQVWQSYEAVLAYETVLAEPEKVSTLTLHRLRIAFKHLRYTLEFFAAALPPASADLIAQLIDMQDYLGELHDHDVAVSESDQLLNEHKQAVPLQAYRDTRANQRDQLQLNFSPKWAKINSPGFRQKLGTLLK